MNFKTGQIYKCISNNNLPSIPGNFYRLGRIGEATVELIGSGSFFVTVKDLMTQFELAPGSDKLDDETVNLYQMACVQYPHIQNFIYNSLLENSFNKVYDLIEATETDEVINQ